MILMHTFAYFGRDKIKKEFCSTFLNLVVYLFAFAQTKSTFHSSEKTARQRQKRRFNI
jgi:hypothetical protein